MGGAGLLPRGPRRRGQTVRDRDAAAQRHRVSALGSRVDHDAAGHADAHEADGRLQHALAPGHRPRRDRRSRRPRAAARRRGQDEGRPRPRWVPGARLEMEGRDRGHDRPPAATPGRLVRLVARALHDGSRAVARGPRVVRPPLGRRADLPRRLHRQLVSALPDRPVRPRGRARGARRGVRLHQVRSGHPRNGAARDQAGRHRPGGPPQGQALPASGRQNARGPVGRRHDLGEGRRR